MTDKELMQQALEALERYGGVDQRACDAEEALRERLAQANEFEPDWDAMAVMVEEQQRMAKRIEELEAQQKPNYTEPEEKLDPGTWREVTYDQLMEEVRNRGYEIRNAKIIAPRQWKGLTDEEADELVQRFSRYELLRAIEAKLKEKNHG